MRGARRLCVMALGWLVVVLAVVVCMGCDESPWHEERFIIPVDSIGVPERIAISDTLCIVFYGYIGGSSAFRFDGFDTRRDCCDLWITAWGAKKWREGGEFGTPVVVLLDGEQYCLHGLSEGWFRIAVRQPDESMLEDSVLVSEKGEAR